MILWFVFKTGTLINVLLFIYPIYSSYLSIYLFIRPIYSFILFIHSSYLFIHPIHSLILRYSTEGTPGMVLSSGEVLLFHRNQKTWVEVGDTKSSVSYQRKVKKKVLQKCSCGEKMLPKARILYFCILDISVFTELCSWPTFDIYFDSLWHTHSGSVHYSI